MLWYIETLGWRSSGPGGLTAPYTTAAATATAGCVQVRANEMNRIDKLGTATTSTSVETASSYFQSHLVTDMGTTEI
jgi:hypothetical protein